MIYNNISSKIKALQRNNNKIQKFKILRLKKNR